MPGAWTPSYLILLVLLSGGLGLVGVDARKPQWKWKGAVSLLQKVVRQARPPCKGCRGGPAEQSLIRGLLDTYDKLPRPVTKDSRNVTVHFAVSLMELLNLVEATGRVGMRMNLRLWWNDPQLQWDPREYAGVEHISLPPDLIWTPDINLYNGVDNNVNREVKLTVYNNGDVLWMPPSVFHVTCTYEFRSDSWHCPLRFRSWTYDASQLDIVPFKGLTDIDKSELMYNAHWSVIQNSGEREMIKYPCCEEVFPTMVFKLGVRMKIGHPAIGKRSIRRL